MSNIPSHVAELSLQERRELLKKLLEQAAASKSQSTVSRTCPVSFGQQRLWFLDRLMPGDVSYLIPAHLRLKGDLNVEALERALNETIRRHESLRTAFALVEGQPVQLVAPALKVALPVLDLMALSEAAREAEVQRLANDDARQSFDLAKGPLVRAGLLRLRGQEHVLLLTMHHIISDGWSVKVLMTELAAIYEGFSEGRPSPLPELPLQYRDFARWQRAQLQGDVLNGQLPYWSERLKDLPPPISLPTDRPRPDGQTFRGASKTIELPPPLTRDLKSLSRREGATLFMTLLAAFQVLLHRYTGQTDIVVGSPIAGRNHPEVEQLIGFFINTLVLRTDLRGKPSFRELLRRVRETTLEAYANQDVPFELLVERLNPARSLNQTPLFQVFFNMLNLPELENEISIRGLAAERLSSKEVESKFDLTMYVSEKNETIHFELVYNPDLFESIRMAEMLEQMSCLLSSIARSPEERISCFSLVTARAKLLLPDPAEPLECDWEGSIHAKFSWQARNTPGQTALIDSEEVWTYGELLARSNQLAHCLIDSGIKPQDTVAIYGHRSASLIWAIMATLKARAAFVMLDPSYPPSRLIDCMRAANPQGWLQIEAAGELDGTLAELVASIPLKCRQRLPARTTAEEQGLLSDYATDDPGTESRPDDIAYVTFTSGTTGAPNGVVGTHRPLSHFLHWHCSRFGLTGSDRFSMLSGLSHDPLLRDVFTPLWVGASLHIPDPDRIGAPGWLARWIAHESITITHLTPAMAQLLCEAGAPTTYSKDILTSLRYVFIGGDALRNSDVSRSRDLAPNATCVNFYGTTETPQAVAYFVVPDDAGIGQENSLSSPGDRVPLGRGVSDVQLLVLSDCGQLAGVGELGEIHVRTPYLAKGYLGNDSLSRQRFIVNSFTNAATDRVYKTGDLGRYLPDGNVDFIGRSDDQVKIRGYRVELGEIDAAVRMLPRVLEAVTVVRQGSSGDVLLVAYYTASAGPAISVTELRSFLKSRLPDYMLPSAFVRMDTLPLSPNGKVYRSALPLPSWAHQNVPKELLAASGTPVMEMLAEIFAGVLRLDRVGPYDDFFEMGGHSLLAAQLISRVRDAFNVELPLRSLFQTPTVSGLAGSIESGMEAGDGLQAPPIKRIPRKGGLPLSFAQRRLWFLEQLDPGNSAYNIAAAVRLEGRLDIAALERSFNEITSRHEVLRTCFVSVEGSPGEVVSPAWTMTLPVVNLTSLSESQREAEAQRLMVEETHRPFDLAQLPLLRVTLVQLREQEHVMLLAVHHIIFDGWSMGVLVRELTVLYEAFSRGSPSTLPDLPIQYADYANWQREWLQGEVLQKQLSYWTQQLGSASEVLELAPGQPRQPAKVRRGGRRFFSLDRDLTESVKRLGQQERATLFMTLLAAFKAVLYRYTGQESVTVGSPIANRGRLEIEGLIGMFVNTLVLKTELSGDPSFKMLVGRVRDVCLGAFAHHEVPFEKLVEELQPERSLGYSPLFQVMFILQDPAPPDLQLGGLKLKLLPLENRSSKFDLTLIAVDAMGSLRGVIEYDAELFDATTIERLAGHFEALLNRVALDADRAISELDLILEPERQQLVAELNATFADYPNDTCIHQLFEEQVERTPNAVALTYEHGQLSFADLNGRADLLANYLRALGVGPEVIVAICVEPSLEMVVGLLGILKAGGALAPLDPRYPRRRLAFMLEDSGAAVVLTQSRLLQLIPEHNARSVCLDDWEPIARQGGAITPAEVTARNLAYVIYTSGSTGRPKGVMGLHRGTVNRFAWMTRQYPFDPDEVCCQKTSLSFVDSVWEIFGPLLQGNRLVIVPEPERKQVDLLVERLASEKVTRIVLVPSQLEAMLSSGTPLKTGLPDVKYWTSSGEALPGELCYRFHQELPGRTLINLYGSSEVSADATCYDVRGSGAYANAPIGRPIANTEVYILGKHLTPALAGTAGELYIAGAGLARGYFNNPELTSERFIPSPFGSQRGDRLYRTGDVAKYAGDGNIRYLGRTDNQVKIRGHRIELGEVEEKLARQAGVKQAVVEARDYAGDKRLVAYLAPKTGQEVSVVEVDRKLREELPDYMVPTAFVIMQELPLTPNGKIDRRSLPGPGGARFASEESYVPPRTPVEEIVTRLWTELLRVERCGLHDNFFNLGGHSLLATQLISRVRQVLQVDLPLRSLFESPTIEQFALAIDAAMKGEVGAKLPALVPFDLEPYSVGGGIQDGFFVAPVSFAQQRLWFLDQLDPGNTAYNIATAVRLKGTLNAAALEASINQVIERHSILRTCIRTARGQPVQVIMPAERMALTAAGFESLPDSRRQNEAKRSATDAARKPFDLAAGPLLRAMLVKLGGQEHLLLLTMHHAICDLWSVRVMIAEVAKLYEAANEGKPASLAELPVQYAHFATWQRQWLQGETLEAEIEYWKRQLEGVSVLQLPADRPRPAVQTFRGARLPLSLSKSLTDSLDALSRREGVTLFMTLLGAFQTLLYRYTGQTDIAVGSPIASRHHGQTEKLLGYFANTLVLRANLSGNPTFRQVLSQVRETALSAYSHQDFPFEKIVEVLQPERDLSHNPLFQVLFALQNVPFEPPKASGLTMEFMGIDGNTARFDLVLGLTQTAEAITGAFEYNTDLFDAETISRFADHLVTLLQSICDGPERRISILSLMTSLEMKRQVVDWNNSFVSYRKDVPLHRLFEEQAGRAPGAIALVCGAERLTYGELNRRANQVARHLQRFGEIRGNTVCICVERHVELIVSMIGILKAGGAYLPLDPAHPKQRLAYMLEDTSVKVLLTGQRLLAGLGSGGAQRVCLDSGWDDISQEGTDDLPASVPSDSLAYVIYTSGSTGRPKGVQIKHSSIASLVRATDFLFQSPEQEAPEQEIWTLFHSCAFDFSAWEIWGCLLRGSRLVIVPPQTAQSPAEFFDLLRAETVTVLNQTPSSLRQLVNLTDQDGQKSGAQAARKITDLSLRVIICGGEALPAELADQVLDWQVSAWNFYGPTEAAVWAAAGKIEPNSSKEGLLPIGSPLANTQIYLLDANLEMAPVGVPGQLHIGGDGLAWGYLNRAELTAERFIPDHFSGQPGRCLYRTGDLASYRPNGEINYLGRMDHQVKIRGYRIEIGEVESVLSRCPGVKQAVVVDRLDKAGAKQLMAYIVNNGSHDPTAGDLRDFLKKELPDHMVPSAFAALESLPMTPNGKIDRKALSALDQLRPGLAGQYVAPRGFEEAVLAGVWADLLGLEEVGVHDSFFELGGHSLLTPAIVTKARELLRVELSLRDIFESPTIAELAECVERARRLKSDSLSWSPLVALHRGGRKRPFFCVHAGGGGVGCYLDLARHLGEDQPFYGLQAPEVGDSWESTHYYSSVEEMAAEYVEAVCRARPEGPYLIGGWSAGGVIAFEVAQQLKSLGKEVGLLALMDCMPRSMATVNFNPGALAFLYARSMAVSSGKDLPLAFDAIQDSGLDEQLSYLSGRLKAAGILPEQTRVEWFRRILDGMMTRDQHLRRYVPRVYPGRITLFRGNQVDADFIKAQDVLDGNIIDHSDPTNGWGRLSTEPVEVHEVPGHHYTIVVEPNVKALARQLRLCIEKVQARQADWLGERPSRAPNKSARGLG
jgi:amino acid adenylation domain-containing protein